MPMSMSGASVAPFETLGGLEAAMLCGLEEECSEASDCCQALVALRASGRRVRLPLEDPVAK
jgi:hypothetical protein